MSGITRIVSFAAAFIALMLLVGGNFAVASPPPALSANIVGGVVDAGNQEYNVRGGQLVGASVFGTTLVPGSGHVSYSLHAVVSGLTVQGTAQFELKSTGSPSTGVAVKGDVQIIDAIAAVDLGTSEVPAFFVGVANMQITQDGISQELMAVPMVFESPYLNPFGAPIVFGTADLLSSPNPNLVVVATYTTGTIQWTNVITAGTIQGTLGSSPFSGTFTQLAQASENLVTGKEVDSGTFTFSDMTISSLNGGGDYHGTSVIPLADSFDCSPPTLPGTCLATGLTSTGHFRIQGNGLTMLGEYETSWSVPAFFYTSTVIAKAV